MVTQMRVKGIWGISVPFCQFCCKPKTALKKKGSKRINTQGRHFWQNFHFTFTYIYMLYTHIYMCFCWTDIKCIFLDQKCLQATVVKLHWQIKAQINLKKKKGKRNQPQEIKKKKNNNYMETKQRSTKKPTNQ